MAVNTSLVKRADFHGLSVSVDNERLITPLDSLSHAVIPLERIQTLLDQLEEATLVKDAITLLNGVKNPRADFGGKIARYGEDGDVRCRFGSILLYCAVERCVDFLERDVSQEDFNDDLKMKIAMDIFSVLSTFGDGVR